MDSINDHIREYSIQLRKGQIQKAYRGIMDFMAELKGRLERRHPDYAAGALYYGYMDMTYFSFTPPALRDLKLKIAIVFLHEECRFEIWLAATNRKVQSCYSELLRHKDLGRYKLSEIEPGVDSIISVQVDDNPDFDNPEGLKEKIESQAIGFTEDVSAILKNGQDLK